ncbi:MAG: GH3 auxin-responsive promoter family protein [Paracoccaceae bacterium]|nr:GH3 auxin-responsive promoter family protein [Paracoccaceae bacterium]
MIGAIALRAALIGADLRYRRPLLAAARDPARAQEEALRRILAGNAQTEFGASHGFAGISEPEAFRAAVPVQTYETLAEAITRQAETGAPALTAEPPLYYARTSGTTAPARDFPVTASGQAAQRAAQRVLAATLARGTGFFSGRIAGLGGARIEGHLASGQPYGATSGQTYATAPRILRQRFVVSEEVFAIADPAAKYRAYADAMAAAPDLTGIITANPSTLLSLLPHLPDDPAALWPRLDTLATWTGGNCRAALDRLVPLMPEALRVVEIGYRASEFVGTINLDAARNLCLPDLTNTVFEFVEEDAWEADRPDFLWLDQIEEGRRYYIFATTQSGLYRYNINDVVEVTGRIGRCPTLAFARKGQGMTSITGEKLHEDQVIAAYRAAARSVGVAPGFFLVIADPDQPGYRLFCEEGRPGLAEAFDRALSDANIEYAAKRGSGRLAPVKLVTLRPGTGEAMKAAAIAAGQREAQLKLPVLTELGRLVFDLRPWVLECA